MVTLPSGRTAIVRKIRRLDFYPSALLTLEQLTPEAVDAYFGKYPEELPSSERRALAAGMVAPRVSAVPAVDGALFADDIAPEERDFLLRAIAEWSGFEV